MLYIYIVYIHTCIHNIYVCVYIYIYAQLDTWTLTWLAAQPLAFLSIPAPQNKLRPGFALFGGCALYFRGMYKSMCVYTYMYIYIYIYIEVSRGQREIGFGHGTLL